jgi:hypothetical protein
MAGLVPAIHVPLAGDDKDVVPGMTYSAINLNKTYLVVFGDWRRRSPAG